MKIVTDITDMANVKSKIEKICPDLIPRNLMHEAMITLSLFSKGRSLILHSKKTNGQRPKSMITMSNDNNWH